MCFHTKLVDDIVIFKQHICTLKQSWISLHGYKLWQLLPYEGALQHLLLTMHSTS